MAEYNVILEEGDTAYYPHLRIPSSKTMKILGNRIMHYGTNDYVMYFFEGTTPEGDGLTDRLVQHMHENVENNYDNLVVIYGQEGVGKSNLAVELCKLYDPTFTLEDRYIYDLLPFLQKLQADFHDNTGKAYLLDEATNLASNRDWNKEGNKHMIQLLEMFRSRGLTLIMCIPSFDRLDIYIREHRARFKLECMDLAEGSRFGGRGYYKLTICNKNLTVGIGTFSKMSDEDKQIYENLKLRSQETKLNEMIAAASPNEGNGRYSESSKRNRKMALYFLDTMGWSYEDVSRQFGIPQGTLRKWRSEDREGD